MTAHHGTPVPITTRGVSSQAGVSSIKAGMHHPDGTRIWICPKCHSHIAHGYRRGEGWEECTNPSCDHARED